MFARAALSALVISLAVVAEGREGWWHTGWEYRLWFDVPHGRTGLEGPDIGVAAFHSAGRLQEGARDLRAVSDGVPVPHTVLVSGRSDDFCRVAFEIRSSDRRVAVYLGNPRAKAPARPATTKRGCLLETFEYRGGSPGNLEGMRQVLSRAEKAPFGADFVPNVFFGLNPFGPSDRFVSRYTGWLVCAESGTHIFCTSSDDASFLLVDGELVVAWPGWHGAVPVAKHKASRKLQQGLHKLEYLHVNGGGPSIAVAAWQRPSENRILPIPPAAFAPVARCTFAGIERLGGGPAAHFDAEVVGECFFEERVAYRLRCRDLAGNIQGARTARWSFGDGLSGVGSVVEHVYFADGIYEVTLAAGSGRTQVTAANRVRVETRWGAQTQRKTDGPQEFARIVRAYDLDQLDARSLEAAALLFKAAEDDANEERVLAAIVARPAEVADRVYFEAVVFLAQRWRERRETRPEAYRLLDQAESHLARKANLRARVIRERGDILFYYDHDLDRALGEYDKVVGRFAERLEDHIVRITKIRIGDVFRKKGDHQKALAAYREAERFRIHGVAGDPEVRRGTLLQAAENAIARRRAEEAHEALDALEWEFPAEKLGGQTSILRARAALLERNQSEALVQLDDLVRVSPGSNEAAEALFMASEIERSQGRTAEAIRRYERIVSEYPDSPRASDARLRLKGAKPPGTRR